MAELAQSVETPDTDVPHRKLTAGEHLACGWPLILLFVGGALGGLCGGVAYAVNAKVMKSDFPGLAKAGLIALSGLGALLAYVFLVLVLVMTFPDLFARP